MDTVKQRISAARPYLLDIARILAFQGRKDRIDSASWFETTLQLLAPGISRDYWAVKNERKRREEEQQSVPAPSTDSLQVSPVHAPTVPAPPDVPTSPVAAPPAASWNASEPSAEAPTTLAPSTDSAIPPVPSVPVSAAPAGVEGATTAPVAAWPPPPISFGNIASPGAPASVMHPVSRAPSGPGNPVSPGPSIPSPRDTVFPHTTLLDARAVESVYGGEEDTTGPTQKSTSPFGGEEIGPKLDAILETLKQLLDETKKANQDREERVGPRAQATAPKGHSPYVASPIPESRASVPAGGDTGALNAAIGRAFTAALEMV